MSRGTAARPRTDGQSSAGFAFPCAWFAGRCGRPGAVPALLPARPRSGAAPGSGWGRCSQFRGYLRFLLEKTKKNPIFLSLPLVLIRDNNPLGKLKLSDKLPRRMAFRMQSRSRLFSRGSKPGNHRLMNRLMGLLMKLAVAP